MKVKKKKIDIDGDRQIQMIGREFKVSEVVYI